MDHKFFFFGVRRNLWALLVGALLALFASINFGCGGHSTNAAPQEEIVVEPFGKCGDYSGSYNCQFTMAGAFERTSFIIMTPRAIGPLPPPNPKMCLFTGPRLVDGNDRYILLNKVWDEDFGAYVITFANYADYARGQHTPMPITCLRL